ncbi:MAG: hypothetical protein ACKOX6_18215, partial [Bdellovibrio sp.]
MPEISDQLRFISSTPQEAAEHINDSKVFNVMPDFYKENKAELKPEVDYLKRPTETTPAVASYLSQSPEHAALVQNDIPKLTDMEKIIKYAGDQVNGVRQKSDQINELALKKMFHPESFTPDDDDELFKLNEEIKAFSDYGTSDDQKLIGQIAGGVASMGASLGKHAKLIAAGTGMGAFIGAGTGSAFGGVGAIPGAVGGALTGFGNSATLAFALDGANAQMGAVFNELDNVTLPNGQPLDHETKKYTAAAVGVTTGIITAIVGKKVAGTIPFLNNFMSPNMAAKLVSDPTKAALTKSLMNFGRAVTVGSGGAGVQRAIEIFGTEFAKNYDGTEGSLINSLSVAAEQLNERKGEIGTATIVGGAVTGVVSAAGNIAGFGQTKKRYQKAIDAADEARFQNARDVGQSSAEQLHAPLEPTAAPTDIIPEKPLGGGDAPSTPHDKALQVLRYDEALDHVIRLAKSTELQKLAPHEQTQIIQKMLDQAGIKKLWTDKEDLTLWAQDEKMAAAVRDIIDPSGVTSASRNTPIAVEPHKWIELMVQYPEAADLYKLSPEGPTVAQAKKFMEDQIAADEQRAQVLEKLKVNPSPTSEDTAMVQNALNPEQPSDGTKVVSETQNVSEQPSKEGELVDASSIFNKKKIENIESTEPLRRSEWEKIKKRYQEISDLLDMPDITVSEVASLKTEYLGLRAYVEKKLPPDPNETAAPVTQPIDASARFAAKASENKVVTNHDVFGEQEFMDQTQLKEALKMFMGEKQAADYLAADERARQSVVDNINDAANYELNQVIDINLEYARDAEYEAQLKRIENNPNVALVEKFKVPEFKYGTRYLSLEEMTANHAKPGYSPLAIDPRTLSPELQEKYAKDPQLKKHKVFVKGGISGDDAAQLLGINGAENLLKVLSTTPTREEIAEARTKAREADLEREMRESTPVNQTALAQAYSDRLGLAVQKLHHMKAKEWPAMRGGIKKIAIRPPTTQELLAEARQNIRSMKVGDLNVNQFKVGERKSNRLAVEAIVKHMPEKAFMNQKAVAQNIALAREAHIAIGKVNRVIRFAKKFRKPENRQQIKEAGPVYEKAVNEILDVFNLDPDQKGAAEKGSFRKYVEESLKGGGTAIDIPERLWDVRQNVTEMTVEQTLAVGDALKSLLHNAKWKNQLFRKHENIKAIQTMDNFARLLTEQVSVLPDYDLAKNDVVQKSAETRMQKFTQKFIGVTKMLEKSQHQLVRLDGGRVTGLMNDLVWRPIVDANNAEKTLGLETFNQLERIINIFDKEEFEAMVGQYVDVPEFKDSPSLNGGHITKLDLFTMMLNLGNEGNLVELEKFGVSRQVIMTVLEREFDHKHMELAQRHWDIDKSFEQKIIDLEVRTEGVEPELVMAQPVEFKGRVYPGGYFPIFRLKDDVKISAQKMEGAAKLTAIDRLRQNLTAKAQTEQGHLEARVGNDSVLDLDYGRYGHSLAQKIHDLTHREAIRDVSKVLSDEKIRKQIVAVLGKSGYTDITDMVIAVSDAREDYSRANGAIKQMMDHLKGGIQTVSIAGKVTSVIMQVASIPFAIDKMGQISGTKHMTLTTSKLMQNPDMWHKYFEFAAEIHPAIRDTAEGIEGDIYHKFGELTPQEKMFLLSPINAGIQSVKEASFHLLGSVDMLNKIIVVLSAYSQAINGEAPGIEAFDIEGAKKYASNIAELTQTHTNERNLSPIQRERLMGPLLLFFNDANNMFNSSLFRVRNLKNSMKVANSLLGEGGGGHGKPPPGDDSFVGEDRHCPEDLL